MLDQGIFFCEGIFTSFSIMALCWPVTPSEVKFAVDSLLEGDGFELPVPREKKSRYPIGAQLSLSMAPAAGLP
jgi:hypothetical protein